MSLTTFRRYLRRSCHSIRSNHAMQPTAGRRTASLSFMKTNHCKPRSLSPAVADLGLVRCSRVDTQITLRNHSAESAREIRSTSRHLVGVVDRCTHIYRRCWRWMVLRALASAHLRFSRTAACFIRRRYRVRRYLHRTVSIRRLVVASRSSGAFLSAVSQCAAKGQWHALRMWRAAAATPRLEVDSRRRQCELNELHLTNRSSQRPHSEISSASLPRHPAVAYLCLVRPTAELR